MFYNFFQKALGADQSRQRIVKEVIKPYPGLRMLDVGCGPGVLRPYLGDIVYTGVDLNAEHIEIAQQKGLPGDKYIVGNVVTDLEFEKNSFDLILLMGILHHLEDEEARKLFQRCHQLLANKGRIITFDGVYLEPQRALSKFMLDKDAGQNVRTKEQYENLYSEEGLDIKTDIYSNLLRIPYDHCVMTLTRR